MADDNQELEGSESRLITSSNQTLAQPRKYERKEVYCPCTWNECCKSLKSPSLLVKVNEKLAEDTSPWYQFCYQVLLICIHTQKEEEEKAVAAYESCCDILLKNEHENFFKEILGGLMHVQLSSGLFIYIWKGDNEAARSIFSRIKSFHVLNQVCRAAVLAVKACVLHLFGGKAQQEALQSVKTAIELDPDDLGIRRGAWYSLAGRIHAEIRNNQGFNVMPSLEERRFCERSVEKDPFPINKVYLADTYRSIAKMLIQQSFKNNKEEAEQLAAKAKELYEETINDETASPKELCRSGSGLIKLPKQSRNVDLAGTAFERVLRTDPNNRVALIGMGNLMNWCKNDYKEALKYFEKASVVHPVGKNIIELKYKIDDKYCPLEDCDKYIESEKNMILGREDSVNYYHVVKAEYLLVKNKDIMESARCWQKAVTSCPSAKEIWEYKCLFAKEKNAKFPKMLQDGINQALTQPMDKEDVRYLKEIQKLFNPSLQDSSSSKKK